MELRQSVISRRECTWDHGAGEAMATARPRKLEVGAAGERTRDSRIGRAESDPIGEVMRVFERWFDGMGWMDGGGWAMGGMVVGWSLDGWNGRWMNIAN